MRSRVLPALILAAVGIAASAVGTGGNDHAYKSAAAEQRSVAAPASRVAAVPCTDGSADVFSCDGLDLLGFVPDDEMVTVRDPLTGCALEVVDDPAAHDPACLLEHTGLSDIWGWTSPTTSDEFVIFGKTNGTAIYNVTDPTDPQYYGEIPTVAGILLWQDIKVYADHAYIASESLGHGLVVFDLRQLDNMSASPSPFMPIAPTNRLFVDGFSQDTSQHNVVVDEDNGVLYLVGSGTGLLGVGACWGGLYAFDLTDPANPSPMDCFEAQDKAPRTGSDGTVGEPGFVDYIHDSHCAAYVGPDPDHQGADICVSSHEELLIWEDVTDPTAITEISRIPYDGVAYAHQGWMSEDQTLYFHGDELDELYVPGIEGTRTIVVDMTDLDNPEVAFINVADTVAIDHNMYTRDGLLYQANYTAGLRIFDVADSAQVLADQTLTEVAYFDTYPDDDDAPVTAFNGSWSVYPYFPSGTIAISGIGEGLFLVGDLDEALANGAAGGASVGDGGGDGADAGSVGDTGDSDASVDGTGDSNASADDTGGEAAAPDAAGGELAATGGGAALLAVLALGGAAMLWRRRDDSEG